jgi:hypothetical protein
MFTLAKVWKARGMDPGRLQMQRDLLYQKERADPGMTKQPHCIAA